MNGKYQFDKPLYILNVLLGDEIGPQMLFLELYSNYKSVRMAVLCQLHMRELHCNCTDSFIYVCIMDFQFS